MEVADRPKHVMYGTTAPAYVFILLSLERMDPKGSQCVLIISSPSLNIVSSFEGYNDK